MHSYLISYDAPPIGRKEIAVAFTPCRRRVIGSATGSLTLQAGIRLAPKGRRTVATGGVRRCRTEPVVFEEKTNPPRRGGGTASFVLGYIPLRAAAVIVSCHAERSEASRGVRRFFASLRMTSRGIFAPPNGMHPLRPCS